MNRTRIIDPSAQPPLPALTGRTGPMLRDALKDAMAFEHLLEQFAPGSSSHIITKRRRRLLTDLDVWTNLCSHSERELVRRQQERRRNATSLARWQREMEMAA